MQYEYEHINVLYMLPMIQYQMELMHIVLSRPIGCENRLWFSQVHYSL